MRVRDMDGYHKTARILLRQLSADTRLSGAEYRVLLSAMLAEKDPGDAVELGTIVTGHATGQAARTVERAKCSLVELGYLKQAGKGHRSATLFTIATPDEMTGGRQTRTLLLETGDTGVCSVESPENAPSSPERKPRRKKPSAPMDNPTWRDWTEACRQCSRPDPAPSPGALKAAKTLAEWVPDPDELYAIMIAYLGLDDQWIKRQGYQLSLLANHRFEAARQAANLVARSNDDLDALGAELITEEKRRRELGIPDWEECPA